MLGKTLRLMAELAICIVIYAVGKLIALRGDDLQAAFSSGWIACLIVMAALQVCKEFWRQMRETRQSAPSSPLP